MVRIALLSLLLSGCGTFNQIMDGEPAQSILISEGSAGGAYALISGDLNTCKVTRYGDLEGLTVIYKGISCEVILNAPLKFMQ